MKRRGMRWTMGWIGAALCAASGLAQASAGRVLFASGPVEIRRASSVIPAQRGTPVEVHDQIVVGAQGRAQLRMSDGALIALQPSSTLSVDDYAFPAEQAGVGSSILKLLKGGLRTITGLIGKRSGDSYQVNTAVATIGVRGTDYRIALCQGDCGATPDGLYLGVSDGSIVVSNGAGELVLLNDEYGYVGGSTLAPQRLLQPPPVLETVLDGSQSGDHAGEEAAASGGGPNDDDDCHCTLAANDPGYRDPAIPGRLVVSAGERLLAQSTSSPAVSPIAVGASAESSPPADVNQAGELTSFRALTGAGVSSFQIGAGKIGNVGFDPDTGLRWGRWSQTALIGGSPVDLTNHDLHWIVSAATETLFALPLGGSASYQLAGNTDPTDNLGHVGFLGSAQLNADFTNQTVTSTLNLSINDQVWTASGTASLHGTSPLFGGNYASVNVAGLAQGNGTFAGFFVPPVNGQLVPAGAGLTYSLSSGTTTVSGAAAFGLHQ